MATEKLYWKDPFARAFEAESARVAEWQGRPSVVLEQTLFYPEAGGQLADQGTLVVGGRTLAIDYVQVDDDGVIHHLGPDVASLGEEPLGPARGEIDTARRRGWSIADTTLMASYRRSARLP